MRTLLMFALALLFALAGCDTATDLSVPAAADSDAVDITNAILVTRSANCAEYFGTYKAAATDVQRGLAFGASFAVSPDGSSCLFDSNAIPNHDFNATGHFATPVSEQSQTYAVPVNPTAAAAPTALSLQYDNAVFLNGVKLDLLAAGCYGVADGNIGCNDIDTPYRYDPMGVEGRFGADEHNAHTQPDGTYHYHGNPGALFDESDASGPSPVIGFAADGFPIFGSYFTDASGTTRKARSSYQLKAGTRPDGQGEPGGAYDGTFIDDWEYVEGSGDLDVCNGMTVNGVYGYFVTETYPHVIKCFTGTPDASFRKS